MIKANDSTTIIQDALPEIKHLHLAENKSSPAPYLIIKAQDNVAKIPWNELWRYRELLYFLIWRDVKIRYKQTVLGALWAILQPLLTMLIFTLFFGKLAGMASKTGGAPYPIYVYAGLLPWTFFANAVTNSSNSLVGSVNLITKIYFPRLIMPVASVIAGLVDLALSFLVLLVMMAYYHTPLGWQIITIPLLTIGVVLIAIGVGSLLSALTVAYRDFRYIVPFMIQIWMFITPVIYPLSVVPAKWRMVMMINPIAGYIEGIRNAVLNRPIAWEHVLISSVVAGLILITGCIYFRKVERRFADII